MTIREALTKMDQNQEVVIDIKDSTGRCTFNSIRWGCRRAGFCLTRNHVPCRILDLEVTGTHETTWFDRFACETVTSTVLEGIG